MLLTGYCSPVARQHLEAHGLQVHAGVLGIATDILQRYRTAEIEGRDKERSETESFRKLFSRDNSYGAGQQSAMQLLSMLPVLGGVVLLVGLFNSVFSKQFVASLFSGHAVFEAFWGACAGSIFTGNAISSCSEIEKTTADQQTRYKSRLA